MVGCRVLGNGAIVHVQIHVIGYQVDGLLGCLVIFGVMVALIVFYILLIKSIGKNEKGMIVVSKEELHSTVSSALKEFPMVLLTIAGEEYPVPSSS